nr:probable serine/threonine-protein kinase At1g54610 isoform X2 [Ipomoea batatas]
MGCVSSKQARRDAKSSPVSSASVHARKGGQRRSQVGPTHSNVGFGGLEKIREESEEGEDEHSSPSRKISENNSKAAVKKGQPVKKAAFSIKFGRLTEAEHLAAGWPGWLSAVAGEAVEGWLPLRSDQFQRLEKIGQGTYSSVYKARDLDNGKMVALKKVRFDNFQPESVRFMAREITVLRRLDHPNIMKLEGIITSRSSCSIYLVFEYMEHDLSGLLSCPDVKFSDSQIKCFMKQLLSGLEHCHSRGVMHRDIKVSNILVNNEGVLKIGDFGLANFVSARSKQPMTSRVVTLWYRPPELLLGATKYGETVDLWSAGCVFAELFFGRPLLKGRTEVEQLHKIFKLCGSPSDDYWEQSKLPLAAIFKPQFAYESTLRERCKELPKSAVNLIETLLSIEPYKRGTASSSLNSEVSLAKEFAVSGSF